MPRHKVQIVLFSWVLGALIVSGCRANDVAQNLPTTQTPTQSPTSENGVSNADRLPDPDLISQWAFEAEASSEFAIPEWSAEQATGEPNSPGCGDYQFSWASAASDSVDTLLVKFPTQVYPVEIVIHESFNPDQVVKVEVFDSGRGTYYTVLQKNPIQIDRPCPYQLVVPIAGFDFLTDTVRITIDQSQLGLGWNEIDAVQLIGTLGE
jgi:hypothetical protein